MGNYIGFFRFSGPEPGAKIPPTTFRNEIFFGPVCFIYLGCGDCHCLSPVCEHRVNGETQYHCVEEPSILDVWRSALFIGHLHASNQLRVIGVDGKIGPLVESAMDQLCDTGWLDNAACRGGRQLAYETTDQGRGWFYFHHHHRTQGCLM